MTRATIAGGAFATVLALLAVAVGYRFLLKNGHPAAATSAAMTSSTTPGPTNTHPEAETHQGFLFGRITAIDGATYVGRLRWGGNEEAFWGDTFNGVKDGNPWAAQVPPERLPRQSHSIEIFGFEIARWGTPNELDRRFMARFGDIARIEANGRDVRVTLKSGTAVDLDRFEASDLDDGVRVWDDTRGVVDLDSLQIRSIELFPAPLAGPAPYRLHGTVRTRQGDFSGFVQWDREECVGTDTLDGRTAEGEQSLRFDTIRSIARRSPDGSLVTLLDGRELVLSGTNDVGRGNRGVYVNDRRYGRVLIPWDAFERADFGPGGSGPAYGEFPPGRPLMGTVTSRAGARFTGRLVYDLDESETTETFDAPSGGVDYTIPFGLIASIVPGREDGGARRARVTLHGGEELLFEPAGDLGERNAGVLIFVEGRQRPEYVRWSEVEHIDFERAAAMYPPPGGR